MWSRSRCSVHTLVVLYAFSSVAIRRTGYFFWKYARIHSDERKNNSKDSGEIDQKPRVVCKALKRVGYVRVHTRVCATSTAVAPFARNDACCEVLHASCVSCEHRVEAASCTRRGLVPIGPSSTFFIALVMKGGILCTFWLRPLVLQV